MPTKFIGPWTAGLNLTANRDLSIFLSDKELGEAENVIYTTEGFLQPRPGCKVFLSSGEGVEIGDTWAGELRLIGTVDTGINGVWGLIEAYAGGVSYLYKVRDENTATTEDNIFLLSMLTDGSRFTHSIVHTGFKTTIPFPMPDPVPPGTYAYPIDTGVLLFTNKDGLIQIAPLDLDIVTTPIYTVPPECLIPASDYGMIVKDRLFLFNYTKSSMHWSPATYILDFRTDPTTLAMAPFGNDTSGTELIEPTTKDDTLRCVEFYNNNFYMFKRNSTFMFTYQVSPLTDGYMRKISADTGAYASTIFEESIVVINNRGVYRIEGTEFVNLQTKMNFRFEIPLDHPRIAKDDIFIVTFNGNVLFGFRDRVTDPAKPKYHYYNMNAFSGAWSKWSYDYDVNIACPGSKFILCQQPNTTKMKMLFLSWNKKYVLYMHWKPHYDTYDYHLDSNMNSSLTYNYLYMPNVVIKTTASVGDNLLKYKKLYRYYIRMYLSEVPSVMTDPPVWTLSLNYNEYKFNDTMNPIFGLYPTTGIYPDPLIASVSTVTYERTYQVRIPQQRVKEFVFELKRRFTKIDAATRIVNQDADRPIKSGYYFLLSGLWFDYQDKAGI